MPCALLRPHDFRIWTQPCSRLERIADALLEPFIPTDVELDVQKKLLASRGLEIDQNVRRPVVLPEVFLTFYLDTTAHLERHGGEEQVQEWLRRRLGDATHATSTHVKREWKRIVYQAAADILNAVDGARSLKDVRARLRQGFGRVPTQRGIVYDMLVDDGEDCTIEELDRRVRRHLRTGFEALFTDRVEVRDGSRCGIVPRVCEQGLDGRWTFHGSRKKTEHICEQIAFLDRHARRVQAAASALVDQSPREDDRELGRKTLQRMELAASERKGQNCYGNKGIGGDISIAIECEPGETLLSTDQSFDLICPAIGVQHERFVGTRMP